MASEKWILIEMAHSINAGRERNVFVVRQDKRLPTRKSEREKRCARAHADNNLYFIITTEVSQPRNRILFNIQTYTHTLGKQALT